MIKANKLFVRCALHLETLLAEELHELGFPELSLQKHRRGVSVLFNRLEASDALLKAIYTINYRSRIASRVLLPLSSDSCIRDAQELYEWTYGLDWGHSLARKDQTFAVRAHVAGNDEIRNGLYAAQVVKDAVCDKVRTRSHGNRPSVDADDPDLQLDLHMDGNTATVSIDTTGEGLYKRGYRVAPVPAPLHETLAAAVLRLAHYRPPAPASSPLQTICDPLCGHLFD
mmetsp:Transcript_19777/g.32415  ORF Transcript_19777/g.32415 Transcript_19777/m.32415 type:complete len:228 (+) Transcript_19777:973-1656(+)